MRNLEDKIKGCIIGGAIGDALGYPVEFIYSFHNIQKKYGDRGIVNYDLEYTWLNDEICKAQVSDDTQMTLYTLEALLQDADSTDEIIQNVTNSYLIWMGFQTGENVQVEDIYKTSKIPELNQRRAPGNTCLSALTSINRGKEVVNNSKGCGGIMRIAPVGIYGNLKGWTLEHTAEVAGKVAEITHKHPLSTYSSALCAVLIQLSLLEEKMNKEIFIKKVLESLDVIKNLYGVNSEIDAIETYIHETLGLIESRETDCMEIEQKIGEGWVAEESLAIAIFCVARHIDNFKDCIVAAVNHGGDSDSTGAIAGNIIGAILGYSAIPDFYKVDLQNLEFMETLSKEITEV